MIANTIKPNSFLMDLALKFKMEKIAWSLRRLYCPVKASDLVLEVGSGGSPYFRANVLCDAYEETQERFFVPLVSDRPLVMAFVENLPFKDNAFDFVIASHVLEHSSNPDKFIAELQRVAKAGYIEVPDAFMERLTHYGFHKLEITDKNGELIITKKKGFIHDPDTVELFHNKVRGIFPFWVGKFPFRFHVRYYWSKDTGGIKYRITNPEVNVGWECPAGDVGPSTHLQDQTQSFKAKLFRFILSTVRAWLSQTKRNANLDVAALMKCSECQKTNLKLVGDSVVCQSCNSKTKIFLPKKA